MKYTIDHKSFVPLHAQVESLLRSMADDPEYKNGKLLPNEVDLAKQLGISRNTLRQATNKLVYEGVLIRKKGVGTTFADKSVDTRIRSWSSFSQEMKAKGINIKNFEISVEWVFPKPEVAVFLGISEDTNILKMVRLRGREDGPFVYFVSYFHPRIGLTGEEDFHVPFMKCLRKIITPWQRFQRKNLVPKLVINFLPENFNLKWAPRSLNENVWSMIRVVARLNIMLVITEAIALCIPLKANVNELCLLMPDKQTKTDY
jgi:GntR family transcriptional regulator